MSLKRNPLAIASRLNLTSRKLFIAFTGNAHRLMMDPISFMNVTGIALHNILVIRDLHFSGYRKGISDELSDIEMVTDHIRGLLRGPLEQVNEIYTIGTSSGGYPAIYCGQQLSARTIWTFGGRICKPTAVRDRNDAIRALLLRVTGRYIPNRVSTRSFSDTELTKWRLFMESAIGREEIRRVTEDPDTILDHSLIRDLAAAIAIAADSSILHLYYSPQNAIDTWVANSFREIPSARLHPIEFLNREAEDLDLLGRSSSHIVAKLLHDQGLLSKVFYGYV